MAAPLLFGEKRKMETLTKQESGLYAILILVLLIPGAIYYAWAFSYLWPWHSEGFLVCAVAVSRQRC